MPEDAGGTTPVLLGLALIGVAGLNAAAAGLPLYGDGALYFVEILLDSAPLAPNGRYSAILAQLPLVAAMAVTDEVGVLRHAFSVGYGMLPFLSLLLSWLIVRKAAPRSILFPLLFLVANQVNFSSVSELLMGLYLAWPLVLLAGLRPAARTTLISGLVLAPVLFFLHPLGFALLFFLAWAADTSRQGSQGPRGRHGLLSKVFFLLGFCRLSWSVVGTNAYERAHLDPETAAGYLFPETTAQVVLVLSVLVVGVLVAAACTRSEGAGGTSSGLDAAARGFDNARGRRPWSAAPSPLWPAVVLTLVAGLLVAAEVWVGTGIKLKSAIIFPLVLVLMALALRAVRGARERGGSQPDRSWASTFLLLAVTVAALSFAKAHTWSRATDDLARAMVASAEDCVPHGRDRPVALKCPHMSIVDNWTAPMAALVFRRDEPVALLLPGEGCATLTETGMAFLAPWFARPVGALAQRFGTLRASIPFGAEGLADQ